MNLSHDSPELENAFWIIADPNKPFPSSPLRPFQFCQLRLLLFLRLWSRRFAFFPHTLANLELDFFTVLVPWPIVIWNLKYIHLPSGKEICTFPVSQFMVKAWVDWMPGIMSSRSLRGFCVAVISKCFDYFWNSLQCFWLYKFHISSCQFLSWTTNHNHKKALCALVYTCKTNQCEAETFFWKIADQILKSYGFNLILYNY